MDNPIQNNSFENSYENKNQKAVYLAITIIVVLVLGFFFRSQIMSLFSNKPAENLNQESTKAEALLFLDPSIKEVKSGENFSLNIVLDTREMPIDGVDVYYLNYDPSFLKVVDDNLSQNGVQIKPGSLMAVNTSNMVDETKGKISFSQISQGGVSFTGKGNLATITFKALKAGSSNLKFDFEKGSTVDSNVASLGKDVLKSATGASVLITK